MRILLTNDDGIYADGLTALEAIAAKLSDDVWVVAPELEQSGQSRALTLTTPLRVRRLDPRRFAVAGTPTDCVTLAIHDIIEGARPDLVLSGINRGANAAEDVTVSGTVAGAIQGMAMGIPSIALSQATNWHTDHEAVAWQTGVEYGPGIINTLLKAGWPEHVIMNINFPDRAPDAVAGVEVTAQGFYDPNQSVVADRRTDLRGRDYYWMGFSDRTEAAPQGTDLTALREGRISVTPLHIDLTHRETVHALKKVLGGAPPKL